MIDKNIKKFDNEWNKEIVKENPSLLKCLFRFAAKNFFLNFIFSILSMFFSFSSTFCLKLIIEWASKPEGLTYVRFCILFYFFFGRYFLGRN
jgi:hypothetical protein